MSIIFDMPEEQSSIIKVIGVGGGGSNAVNYMFEQGIKGVNFVICNTDAQALEMSPVPNKIQLGPTLTNGRGAGAMPEVGKNATIESEDEIRDLLSINTKMVFVTAGMGGGTGTGGAPEVAKIAKDLGILTVGIVTVPFDFEGKRKKDKADQGILEMKRNVDAMIVISNNKLRDIYGNLSLTEAFGNADSILSIAAKGISEIITKSGLINVDFEDVKTVMKDSGVALMGTGKASGENRALRAIDAALSSPLLNDDNIHGAKGILLNLTSGNEEIRMDEVTQITEYVQQAAGNNTEIIWGVCYDDALEDEIAVTLIATGFEGKKFKNNEVEQSAQRVVHILNEEKKLEKQEPITFVASEYFAKEKEVPKVDEIIKDKSVETPINTTPSENKQIVFLTNDEEEEDVNEDDDDDFFTFEGSNNEFDANEYEGFEDVYDKSADLEEEIKNLNIADSIVETTKFSMDLFSKEDGNDDVKPQETNVYRQPNMAEIQKERMMKLKNIVSINKIRSSNNLRELENGPAYVRKNVEFNKTQHSSESSMSKYKLEDNYDGKPEIKETNTFLDDNVD